MRRMIPKLVAQCDLPEYRVIVVDYGCPDGAFAWCQQQAHSLLDCVQVHDGTDKFNVSRARNCGVRIAQSDLIVMLDSDCVLHNRTMLRTMVDPVLHQQARLSHVTLYQADGSTYPAHTCLTYHRSEWLAVGGYDEAMQGWGYEDTDFFDRLKQRGHCAELEADHRDFSLINHANELRTQFYDEPSIDASWRRNYEWASSRPAVNRQGFARFKYDFYSGAINTTTRGVFAEPLGMDG